MNSSEQRHAAVVRVPDEGLGNSSYVADVGAGLAVVVDPRRDVEVYLDDAERRGLRIVAALETHLHADFVSGGRELAEATGADLVAATGASLGYRHRAVDAGATVEFGDATFEVVSTPGHTPEHLAFLMEMGDGARSLFSGGSVIVGGAARTDLLDEASTEPLARAQFASFRRLSELPDETLLLPTHGSGSFCSAGASSAATSTIGAELASNPLMRIDDESAFVEHLLSTYGSFPGYFFHLRDVNRAPALRSDLPVPTPLAAHEAAERVDGGAFLIDARAVGRWAERHAAGSIVISLRPQFGSWLGWVVPFGRQVVLIVEDDDVEEAVRQARLVGYDAVLGFVDGGVEAWDAAGLPVRGAEVVPPAVAAEAIERGEAVAVDVRQDSELSEGRVPGSLHIDIDDLIAGRTPDAQRVLTYCAAGERSATAASILLSRGLQASSIDGGIAAWRKAGLPVEGGAD